MPFKAIELDASTRQRTGREYAFEVETRQANIIAQFNADTEQLTKTLADLRSRREVEVSRATKWNAEEARLELTLRISP